MTTTLLWDLRGDVLAAPASALCGWNGVILSLSVIVVLLLASPRDGSSSTVAEVGGVTLGASKGVCAGRQGEPRHIPVGAGASDVRFGCMYAFSTLPWSGNEHNIRRNILCVLSWMAQLLSKEGRVVSYREGVGLGSSGRGAERGQEDISSPVHKHI